MCIVSFDSFDRFLILGQERNPERDWQIRQTDVLNPVISGALSFRLTWTAIQFYLPNVCDCVATTTRQRLNTKNVPKMKQLLANLYPTTANPRVAFSVLSSDMYGRQSTRGHVIDSLYVTNTLDSAGVINSIPHHVPTSGAIEPAYLLRQIPLFIRKTRHIYILL